MSETPTQRRVRERLQRRRDELAARGEQEPLLSTPASPKPTTLPPGAAPWAAYADAAPKPSDGYERSETETRIDDTLAQLGIIEAYNRYIRKMTPKPDGKREGIKISCPLPSHPDKDPSAWLNIDNNTWFCGGCQVGGDQFDLAAIHFGYDGDSYKSGQNWGIFRKTVAQDMGLVIEYIPGVGEVSYASESETDDQTVISTAPRHTASGALPDGEGHAGLDGQEGQVDATDSTGGNDELDHQTRSGEVSSGAGTGPDGQLQGADPGAADLGNVGLRPNTTKGLDWRKLSPAGTFLREFMEAVTIDDVPEEYHFWHAMMGLGLVVGRDVCLTDNPPVYANLFVCLLGTTGTGKSKAKRYIATAMHEAAPWDPNAKAPAGVKMIPTPASAEALIKAFQRDYTAVDANGVTYKAFAPVRGFVEFTELKQLTTRMGRTGNALQPTLIDFFDALSSVSSVAASKDGERYAHQPLASVLTTVQPEILSEVFSDSDEASGFLNRWLFVTGTRKKKQLFNRNVIDLGDAIIMLRKIHTWGCKIHKVTWSKEAEDLFEQAWFGYIQADVDSHHMALARIDLMIKKLGLIFAINEMSDTVTKEMLERVLMLYPYLVSNVQFKTDSLITSGDGAVDEAIVTALTKLGAGLHSGRDISRKIEAKYRKVGQVVIDRHITALSKSGFITVHTVTPTRGRPVIRYELTPEKATT